MAFKRNEVPGDNTGPHEEAASLTGEGAELREPADSETADDLAAISAEIDQIKASVAHIAEASAHYVRRHVAKNSTDLISGNPVRAALWAAFAGFLVGRLTR